MAKVKSVGGMSLVRLVDQEVFSKDVAEENSYEFKDYSEWSEASCKHVCDHVEWCLKYKEYATACDESADKKQEDIDQSFFRAIFNPNSLNIQREFAEFGKKCSTTILKKHNLEEK